MATKIDFNKLAYNKETKTFSISENDTIFATEYLIENPKTGNVRTFKLSHSTGSEFDPATRWIYKSDDLTLEVCNDEETTAMLAQNYLQAKLRN